MTSFRTTALSSDKSQFYHPANPWSPGTSVRGTLAPSGCVRIACLFCFMLKEKGGNQRRGVSVVGSTLMSGARSWEELALQGRDDKI